MPTQVLDIIPDCGYDQTLVLQTETSTDINPNTIMHVIPFVGSLADSRIIVFGRPGMRGNNNNLLTKDQRRKVAGGDFTPLVEPSLLYLTTNSRKKVETAIHGGFSLGGDLVAATPAVVTQSQYDHDISAVIVADGATGHARPVIKLGWDFLTIEGWEKYKAEVQNPAYAEARNLGHNDNFLSVAYALGRPSTLAAVKLLAKGGMEGRLDASLSQHPNLKAVILNCEYDRISHNPTMNGIRERLRDAHGENRVLGEMLPGIGHAVNDQIYANAAVMLRGLELLGQYRG